jgi:hypothetical protein
MPDVAEYLHCGEGKTSHSSQYVLFVFEEPDKGEYDALIEALTPA